MRGMVSRPKPQPQVKRAAATPKKPKRIVEPLPTPIVREPEPKRVRVTMLQPWDKVYVGSRWYVVRKTRMIGKKSNRHSMCIVYTMEKGGLHYRVTTKVLRAGYEHEN